MDHAGDAKILDVREAAEGVQEASSLRRREVDVAVRAGLQNEAVHDDDHDRGDEVRARVSSGPVGLVRESGGGEPPGAPDS